jgi:hypothetical protein
LSFAFKLYSIWIERALHEFWAAAEDKLCYLAPQSITVEMNATLVEQRDELKAINSEGFFAKMGKEVAPQIRPPSAPPWRR